MWLSGREGKQSPFLMDGERGHAAPAPELYAYLCVFIAVSELSRTSRSCVWGSCVGVCGVGCKKTKVLTMPQVGAAGAVLGAQGVMRGRLREDGSSLLRPAIKRRTNPAVPVCMVLTLFALIVSVPMTSAVRERSAQSAGRHVQSKRPNRTVQIYLANGCYWERQWAYYEVETTHPAFSRSDANFSAKVGYAGGTAPGNGAPVCYHSGDARDYSRIGMAEATRVVLDRSNAENQMKALARDFFDSFTGPSGQRARPDPGDRGSPYRSMVGLPGGTSSPLYSVFAAENTFNMQLNPGRGGDADALNVVYVYDSDVFPFFDGEVYHQAHCNFFMSSGMPYPKTYTAGVWSQHKAGGGYYGNLWTPTGCPEYHSGISHPGSLCP